MRSEINSTRPFDNTAKRWTQQSPSGAFLLPISCTFHFKFTDVVEGHLIKSMRHRIAKFGTRPELSFHTSFSGEC